MSNCKGLKRREATRGSSSENFQKNVACIAVYIYNLASLCFILRPTVTTHVNLINNAVNLTRVLMEGPALGHVLMPNTSSTARVHTNLWEGVATERDLDRAKNTSCSAVAV